MVECTNLLNYSVEKHERKISKKGDFHEIGTVCQNSFGKPRIGYNPVVIGVGYN